MRLLVKGARQLVRVVANGEQQLAGLSQKNCNLAIMEECNGIGLSIVIDRLFHLTLLLLSSRLTLRSTLN